MNIVIFASHQWPVPAPPNTGHRVYLDLAIALTELGHDVTMVAPEGTDFPNVAPMPCANGKAEPTATYCELHAIADHGGLLEQADIIHDWSVEKHAAERFPDKSISTVMSGNFASPRHGRNVCVWSNEMRGRALRGASDYEGTEFVQWHSVSRPLKDARVVYGGVDTDFWCPYESSYSDRAEGVEWNHPKDSHFLWLGRWHPARGYGLAIELARKTGIELVMAGEHPDDATNDHQRECALEAVRLAEGAPNIRFEWLPREGHREAVREQYRRARAYLFLPRFHEPFGLSQVEAMACGTPVIATHIGSTPEVIPLNGGLTAEFLSGLSEAVRVLPDGAYSACRNYAVRRFSRRAMAERYLEAYSDVLAGKGWG